MRRPKQLSLSRTAGWGGKRKGAGRPPIAGRRRPVPHRSRGVHKTSHPIHLTLRARREVPSLRFERTFSAVEQAVSKASRDGFRVVEFSAQDDHVHLIVEAQDDKALSSGARGLSIRLARAINKACRRSPTRKARTWLASRGWRRHGLVGKGGGVRKPSNQGADEQGSMGRWSPG